MKLAFLGESFEEQVYSHDDEGPEYSIPKLYAYAKAEMPLMTVPIEELVHNTDPENGASADEPLDSPEFRRRAMKANLNYPVLLHKIDDRYWAIDGVHRIMKAYEFRKKYMKAYVFVGNLPARAQATNDRSELHESTSLQLPQGGIMFQTDSGSKYVWDPRGKSTTRWKSFHKEHGAGGGNPGLQQSSQRTLFVLPKSGFEFTDALNWKYEKFFKFHVTKTKLYLLSKDHTLSDAIYFSWEPVVGSNPLEFWGVTPWKQGYRSANKVHLGNDVVRVSPSAF